MLARKPCPELRDLKDQAEEIERRRESVLRRLTRKFEEMQDGVMDGMDAVSRDMVGGKR
jgi:hypothetical protein